MIMAVDGPLFAILGYVYVTLRLAHMIIHTGYNNIRHRMLVFLASCLVLAAIWIGIALIATG